MTQQTSIITDGRTRDEDLPEVAPGEEFEHVIVPQMFVVLRWITVRDLTFTLIRLEIGMVNDVPFELETTDRALLTYRLKDLDDDIIKKALVATGAAVATKNTIALPPGLEVRAILRNDGAAPAKPYAALIVYDERTP